MVQELTSREERIRATLVERFSPQVLDIVDESAAHAGHAGSSGAGETHFVVSIKSAALDALPRLERHRAVNLALGPEFETGLHALSIRLL